MPATGCQHSRIWNSNAAARAHSTRLMKIVQEIEMETSAVIDEFGSLKLTNAIPLIAPPETYRHFSGGMTPVSAKDRYFLSSLAI